MGDIKIFQAVFSTRGRVVIPAELRRKHNIRGGTKVSFSEDELGRIVLHFSKKVRQQRRKGQL